jgi:hypothetical protein
LSYFNQIRRVGDNRSLVNDLAKRLARFQSQQQIHQSDDTDFIRLVRVDFDRVDVSDNFYEAYASPRVNDFQLPLEPDGDLMRLWIKFNSPSTYEKDDSGYNNLVQPINGPIYLPGVHGSTLSIVLDPAKKQYVRVADIDWIQMTGLEEENPLFGVFDPQSFDSQYDSTTGATRGKEWSITTTISPTSLTLDPAEGTDGSIRIASKTDNENTAWTIAMEQDGTLRYTVRDNGNFYASTTAADAIGPLDTWYDLAFVYSWTDHKPRIYVNAVDLTLSTPDTPLSFNDDSFTDLMIGSRYILNGAHDPFGSYLSAHIDDFRIYRKIALTQQQVANLHTNGVSISNIPLGHVAVIGRSWYFSSAPSFTSISYSAGSFSAG